MTHPHDLIAMLENMGCEFDAWAKPIPDRNYDWTIFNDQWKDCPDTGAPVDIAHGRTQWDCAMDLFESGWLPEYLGLPNYGMGWRV